MAQILLRLITIMVQTIDILPAIQPQGSIAEAKAKSWLDDNEKLHDSDVL